MKGQQAQSWLGQCSGSRALRPSERTVAHSEAPSVTKSSLSVLGHRRIVSHSTVQVIKLPVQQPLARYALSRAVPPQACASRKLGMPTLSIG